jgi:chorismate mutase/prephenate dehydratase
VTDPAKARVAYMGPAGTFSHMAARQAFPGESAMETATIAEVVDRVAQGQAEFGVVPIENSIEGGVTATLDALLDGTLHISGELVIDVALCLVARHADRSRLRRVLSHPQPLAQCRRWLARELPHAQTVAVASTSAAAREAATDDGSGAITHAEAAKLNGLVVLAENVQDREGNATRFVIVSPEDAPPTGHDKTSLVFSTVHERGALRRALGVFDDEGINLTRIESRPFPSKRWEYVFFTDLEGHRSDPPVARALAALAALGGEVRVLGSYPRTS